MSEWCKKHEVEFDINEGCRCCYSEWLIISEFVNDLKKLSDKNSDALVDYYIDEYISKWEEKLK